MTSPLINPNRNCVDDIEDARFCGLDVLRVLTILIIVLYHTCDELIHYYPGLEAVKKYGGYFGNYTFFMLSGFLITHSYKKRVAARKISLHEFIYKRIIKLYPLYILTNVIMLVLRIAVKGAKTIDLERITMISLLQAGGAFSDIYPYNACTWFVCTLLVCQACFYLTSSLCRNREQFIVGSSIIMLWGCTLIKEAWQFPFAYTHTGEGLASFFCGVLLYELFVRLTVAEHNSVKRITIASIGIIIVLGILSVRYGFSHIAGRDFRVAMIFIVCPSVLLLCVSGDRYLHIWDYRKLRMLSTTCLSVFFWHLVVAELFSIASISYASNLLFPGDMYIVYLVALLGIALVSHRYIEPLLASCIPHM